ncbi:MAG: tRNA (uridine(34)/cytosine(34)/5-carboxymethylaminomethyluridine(34)-2'-O)-methyltransferase TrmL [Clostridia bacterium]|nr:tRNA (uridine(34)/cytosine(34)/5-carboxymethylaminomethyluridine(34)-2'-O)-methyltransferase TrmL [Clostridia bacterium]
MFNIVLVEPEIPQNTGNIARTCAATGCRLHLVKPLGFSVDDRALKRAGLDYWQYLDVTYYENLDEFFLKNGDGVFHFFTTKGLNVYSDAKYLPGDFLVFGKETKGLPEELLVKNPESCVRIPMRDGLRSLNLSNSVAVGVFEAFRQNSFEGLNPKGELHNLKW